MKKPQTVTVKVVDAEKYDKGYFPFEYGTTLDRVIEFLMEKRNEIPKEYRATATCEINSSDSYGEGSSHPTVAISYKRPMTEDEIKAEKYEKAESAKNALERARKNYEQVVAQARAAGISVDPVSSK